MPAREFIHDQKNVTTRLDGKISREKDRVPSNQAAQMSITKPYEREKNNNIYKPESMTAIRPHRARLPIAKAHHMKSKTAKFKVMPQIQSTFFLYV